MGPVASPVIVLFRRDLRIRDNGALAAAADSDRPVLPIFILDEESEGVRPIGAASRWWLHHSLHGLQKALNKAGAGLVLKRGRTADVVEEAIKVSGADTVLWNRRYDPAEAAIDAALKTSLRDKELVARSFDGALMHEPSLLQTGSGGFYKVYTPFSKALESSVEPRDPIDPPSSVKGWKGQLEGLALDELELLPTKPDWSGGLQESWTPGEDGARRRLREFVEDDLSDYERSRDIPGKAGTSGLSPHLTFGEITPFQILAALKKFHGAGAAKFRKELAWREFSYHLLFHNPHLRERAFRPEYEAFEWHRDAKALKAWQRGLSGYPIVDAGMRQLWHTGWMHNRVRMIAASFLIKDLLIDWRDGEQWFWDTLVDADPANNPASWQWVAGSGADAAPYFRIFNPVLQGERFDPGGDYVRRWVPEIAKLPDRFVQKPWEASAAVLKDAGVTLGETYPSPIVDHHAARDRAMEAYRAVRSDDTQQPQARKRKAS
ncbi:deoxyribodipyrimidine photolyase [Aquibium oceanicum]|uniref:Deoxyribodipyrimidine photo-lyase n=1 Tax=Aquibium oceanicum TaxID=1670800 RepID=A0A1L3SYK1_9HYPH|nr:deoxyribodipyrimidine photolyase [Aquibium oceanicum]